jgi:hypothetical protein
MKRNIPTLILSKAVAHSPFNLNSVHIRAQRKWQSRLNLAKPECTARLERDAEHLATYWPARMKAFSKSLTHDL